MMRYLDTNRVDFIRASEFQPDNNPGSATPDSRYHGPSDRVAIGSVIVARNAEPGSVVACSPR